MSEPSSRAAPRVATGLLWFGLFGAALAWSLQELLAYAVVAHACYPDWRPRYVPVTAGTWTLALAVAIVTAAIGGLALAAAWRSWGRAASRSREAAERDLQIGEGRVRFMAFGGLLVGGMVMFAVLLNLLAFFLLPVC